MQEQPSLINERPPIARHNRAQGPRARRSSHSSGLTANDRTTATPGQTRPKGQKAPNAGGGRAGRRRYANEHAALQRSWADLGGGFDVAVASLRCRLDSRGPGQAAGMAWRCGRQRCTQVCAAANSKHSSWDDIDVGRSVINVRRSWDGSRGAYSNNGRRWSLRNTPVGSSSRRIRMNVSAVGYRASSCSRVRKWSLPQCTRAPNSPSRRSTSRR